MKISKERLKEIVKEELAEANFSQATRGTGPTELGHRAMITKEQADEYTRIFAGIFWDDAINFYRKEVGETIKLYSEPGHRLDMTNINAEDLVMAAFADVWDVLKEGRGDVLALAIRRYLEQFVDKEGSWKR